MNSEGTSETLLIYGVHMKCPGCGCDLTPYEVFACRIRGLKKPVCLGCLIEAAVAVAEHVWPLLNSALKQLEET